MAKTMTFGEFLRAQRLKAGLGLRAFAEAAGLQPSNLSNIEHGRIPPPQDREILNRIADLLNLVEESADRATLFDLAVRGRDRLPADVAAFAARTPGIPVLLRTIENRGLSQTELARLTKYVNRLRRKKA
jgi:transcriptional regulator with XRE-family HTH domain